MKNVFINKCICPGAGALAPRHNASGIWLVGAPCVKARTPYA